jgi:DNA mismatch repair ATPase MutL
MSETMYKLSRASIQKLNSGQVVPTIPNAVKELVEYASRSYFFFFALYLILTQSRFRNSLDAGAKNIEILLEKGGLDLIRVKDDGVGISKAGHATCALPHYTSKLTDFSELESLRSYGFRGEALSALANVGRLSIFTRTKDDEVCIFPYSFFFIPHLLVFSH